MPSGKGGAIGRPFTKWLPGDMIGTSRPASAVSAVGISILVRDPNMGTSGLRLLRFEQRRR